MYPLIIIRPLFQLYICFVQVKYHRQHYKPLHREINRSIHRVRTAKADRVRPRPISAPDLPSHKGSVGNAYSCQDSIVQRSRPTSVLELSQRFLQRPPTSSTCTREGWCKILEDEKYNSEDSAYKKLFLLVHRCEASLYTSSIWTLCTT